AGHDLGGGGEERAEGHVAGAGGDRVAGQLQAVVAGGTEDGIRSEQGAGRGQDAVVLAQMGAGRADLGRKRGVVVDQQRYPGACALLPYWSRATPAPSSRCTRASRRAVSGSSGGVRYRRPAAGAGAGFMAIPSYRAGGQWRANRRRPSSDERDRQRSLPRLDV